MLAVTLFPACGDDGPDLPEGWEEATAIFDFTQSACAGDPLTDDVVQNVEGQALSGSVRFTWSHITFRCDQAVQGYVRRGEGVADVLVQPLDLEPDDIARCNCLYNLDMAFNTPSGPTDIGFWRRPDVLDGPNPPVQVLSISTDVP
ncbi:MAG: hypothetical protein ACI9MC_003289 [Kiritimatiellia bacterium]